MRNKLYKLAVWYIGKCNAKWGKTKNEVKKLDRLTYWQFDKYMLFYGADAEWQNFSRYDVLDNAIQRLAKYEDEEKEIRNKAVDDVFQWLCNSKYAAWEIDVDREGLYFDNEFVSFDEIAQQLKDSGTDA